jgi:hypothetical protein
MTYNGPGGNRPWLNLLHCSDSFSEGLRNTSRKPNEVIRCFCRDLNREPLEYNSEAVRLLLNWCDDNTPTSKKGQMFQAFT